MASIQVLLQSAYVSLPWLTLNMAYHKWTVLNTRSKIILKLYLGACNIQFIESAHFKYGIYKPQEVEHQTKKLVRKAQPDNAVMVCLLMG